MANKVVVVNSCSVPPALPTPSSPIWLSNLDLFANPNHVRVVFFFRNNSSPLPSPPAASIKASLARMLVPYYPFAGRFGNSADGRREIRCTGDGALFFEAVSDLTLDEFGVYTPSVDNCRLLVPTDGFKSSEKGDDNVPILLVQLTTFRCGGICLGTGLHHHASDGIAAMRFISNWAAATRDPTGPIPTPCFDHTSLRARSPPSVRFRHPEFDMRKRPEKQITASFVYLNLAPDQLAAIKASSGGKYSSYESLAAYIWRCTCLARGSVRPDEEIRLVTTADVRRRLGHLLPNEYVGNAIVVTAAVAPSTEVAAALPVARIREAIEKLDDEYLQSAIDFLELQEDKRRLSRAAGNFAATDISVTSWGTMRLYEADFGWGSPEFMGPAAFIYPGQTVVMPSPDGGVKIGCSLEAEKMDGFVKLFHELLPSATVVNASNVDNSA